MQMARVAPCLHSSCSAKPFINGRQRKTRLLFAGDHKDWTVDDWAIVLFSNGSNFELIPTPANLLVRSKPGEAYKPDCLAPTVKHGGGMFSFFFWVDRQMQLCEGQINHVTYTLLPSAG